ncbi:MAG TPA: C4-type zinc ribbon domain-containing protein [Anaerolineales bacterium]
MSAALGLFRLQQVDRQIDQVQARLNAIQQILENDAELRAALNGVETTGKEKTEAEKLLHEAEAQVKSQQIKIEQAESSLYGGSVHNPKELQDLQNDVASLKRHLSTLEERQLEAMIQLDTAQAGADAAAKELSDLQSRRGSDHSRLFGEQSTLQNKLVPLQAERKAVMTDLAAKSLELYEDLRGRRRGIAVAEVTDDSCSACGTTLNAALQQSARSTIQMSFCPSCGRILYAS